MLAPGSSIGRRCQTTTRRHSKACARERHRWLPRATSHQAQLHRETAATASGRKLPARAQSLRWSGTSGRGKARGAAAALCLSRSLSEESPRLRASAGAWRGGATRSGRGLDRSSGRLFAAAAAFAENGMSVFERHHYG